MSRGLGAARLVLANSQGIAELARAHGPRETRVVHLGAELPATPYPSRRAGAGAHPTIVTVGHLVARKRHADVLRALAVLSSNIQRCATQSSAKAPSEWRWKDSPLGWESPGGSSSTGSWRPREAIEQARQCTLFVMPSTEEAFGVAYIEAMAGGLPAIGCRGEPGPEEIAAAGDGFMLVPPGDIERLTQRIDELLSDTHRLREASQRARATVAADFTWERCGVQTLAAYEHALR